MWPRFTSGDHPVGLCVFHDGFSETRPNHTVNHRPLVDLGVFAGALLMVLRALSFGLIFKWKPESRCDAAFLSTMFLHMIFHTRKRRLTARENVAESHYLLRFHHVTESNFK